MKIHTDKIKETVFFSLQLLNMSKLWRKKSKLVLNRGVILYLLSYSVDKT